ncbi:hypothetical protein ACVOMV_31290 [Mesorhizobium atlanticum]
MDETRVRDVPSEDALDAQIGYNLRRASALALNDFSVEMGEASLRPVTYAIAGADR